MGRLPNHASGKDKMNRLLPSLPESRTASLATRLKPTFLLFVSLALLLLSASSALAAPTDHWVGTWAAAPVSVPNRPATAASDEPVLGATDMTLREIVHVSLGGDRVRIVLSNEFGSDPLTIGAAHVALSAGGSEIKLGSANALTFGGKASITIPPGASVVSDPADLKLPALADLAVSLFIPAQALRQLSAHVYAAQKSYLAAGNTLGQKELVAPKELSTWPFLKGIDVLAGGDSGAIVAFGDSITDGYRSTTNANARWPDELSRRLQADKKLKNLAVLNEGIGGNRVLREGFGPSALSRFDRDVLSQAGVKYLIFMESINDIGTSTKTGSPYPAVAADDLIAGLHQLIERAHIHGIKVIGATLTPYVGASYASPAGEKIRTAVNDWIRTDKSLDGVIDFDLATRDPAAPDKFLPAMDSGDHLHPGDAGYKAMGDAIDLKLFIAK
jgi:lysophospholipase L1-like esterase